MRKNNLNFPSNATVESTNESVPTKNSTSKLEKRKHEETETDKAEEEETGNRHKHIKSTDSNSEIRSNRVSSLPVEDTPHYSFIMDLKISSTKMATAELCGLHLAEKLKEMGADVIIRECKAQVLST